MPTVDLFLQKKGGVGKTVSSALYSECLIDANADVLGIDVDPSNQSLFAYARKDGGLPVIRFDSDGDDGEIELSRFNGLVPLLCAKAKALRPDAHIVVDCGASGYPTFVPWLKAIGMEGMLRSAEASFVVRVHVVLVGGADRNVTAQCLEELLRDFPQEGVRFIAWLNPFFGNVVNPQGDPFTRWRGYRSCGERFEAVIDLPKCSRGGAYKEYLQRHFARAATFGAELAPGCPGITSMDAIALSTFWGQAKGAIQSAFAPGNDPEVLDEETGRPKGKIKERMAA